MTPVDLALLMSAVWIAPHTPATTGKILAAVWLVVAVIEIFLR
jgi:hypothetical protein